MSLNVEYEATVCILVLEDIDVNACIKKAVKILLMKRIVTICLMLLFYFFSFSLNDAIDLLMKTEDNSDMESSSDEDDHDLAMLPPIGKANAETDMDSDPSDDGLVHHLPRRLLNSTCDLSLLDKGNKQKYVQYTQNTQPEIRNQEN